jgi:hypothetical protein
LLYIYHIKFFAYSAGEGGGEKDIGRDRGWEGGETALVGGGGVGEGYRKEGEERSEILPHPRIPRHGLLFSCGALIG